VRERKVPVMTTPVTARPHPDLSNPRPLSPPAQIPGWMSVAEARATLIASGQHALPVGGHRGLIGMITIEALGGHGEPPPPEVPVVAVMDWHLVPLPVDADEDATLRAFTDAAWAWLRNRGLDAEASHLPAREAAPGPAVHRPEEVDP